ncbi:anthranilate synthase / indole-3-glycerol phosphate synthase [Malassezia vespertilionis]|uniref:Anthranilate synthase component 2 n=1 Tax=Malassezia vespertilionis TaxID=2020962 RepID=A0A2N1JHE3_9BASI|nr:anthranilate synthase / indole-3-glycerol phosphate synthase [Malassezia vespertilionis]PKI85948.1 Trp1p [Malassezia vespertilionis]WFD05289.1 anthranilate synthase / indole-3-glycerol phosphate synthase [Malassezia vespertilionis]
MASLEEGEDGRIVIPGRDSSEQGVTVLIDNYDSFTFNVAQYLVELGANVVIFRNDRVTLETLDALQPVNLVISPGPGHPMTDSGISIHAIRHFGGKIPIMGICMGLQCMIAGAGGIVEYAGEVFHGKTSEVTHDMRGLFSGMPKAPFTATRYHSLAANIKAMPHDYVETSHVESGVIMGVRHKTYTIESVQYHPESIISEHGKTLFANFLSWRGGTWAENPIANVAVQAAPHARETILERIYKQRTLDVQEARKLPGRSMDDLERCLALQLDPPQIAFPERLMRGTNGSVGVMAELKRASPSKGDIDVSAIAGAQALAYARSGANVISVLTEPHWFKGSLEDMALARQAVAHFPNRPAILRKEFIVDEYQIAEARLHGADTVLLIVAMLDDGKLRALYEYAMRLGMDPLVEVNTDAEMQRALVLRPRVIGVNNRNLHTFDVDMNNTSKLAKAALEQGTILAALSGIQSRADVEEYEANGVHAVLVGEALMRANDKRLFIATLQGRTLALQPQPRRLAKVCGLKTVEAALKAAKHGADMLGIILAKGTRRSVTMDQAASIVAAVHASAPRVQTKLEAPPPNLAPADWFAWHATQLADAASKRPLLIGVFRNQPLEEIVETASVLRLDGVQIHGRMEPLEWARFLPGVFVLRVFHVPAHMDRYVRGEHRALDEATRPGQHHIILLDTLGKTSASDGGSGTTFDWHVARQLAEDDPVAAYEHTASRPMLPFILAGGLTPANVQQALEVSGAFGVDSSSGVESDGEKDLHKIGKYLVHAKAT